MANSYQLSDETPRYYYVKTCVDGSLEALEAKTLDDALVEVLALYDFEGEVLDYAAEHDMTNEGACERVLASLKSTIKGLSAEEILKMAAEGSVLPVRAGWVK